MRETLESVDFGEVFVVVINEVTVGGMEVVCLVLRVE